MERLTASNYSSLVESYSAVYNEDLRSKLTEEQEIKEFLEVIDSLVEDGYDLSEYTYDELYEHYLSEGGLGSVLKAVGGRALKAIGGAVKAGWKGTTVQTKQGTKFVPGAEQEVKAAIANTLRRGVKIGVPVGIAAAADQWATGGKIRGALGQQVQSARQAAHGDQPATVKSEPEKPKQPQAQPKPLRILGGKVVGYEHFDMFDVMKGYLIGEGYAETEEAALKIMTNMSEGWKQSIIESGFPPVKGNMGGPNPIDPVTGKSKYKVINGKEVENPGYKSDKVKGV
jgi:hypothetical protein